MDEVQAAFYGLQFHIAFLEKKGAEFQDWFVKIATSAYGPDFEAVRPYGRQGDLKCDGRRISTKTIFQCYAPYQTREAQLNAKIEKDFRGAHEHWGRDMLEWVLVYNDNHGLPPSSSQLLDRLRNGYPDVGIAVWFEASLRELANGLSLVHQQAIFGFAPSKTGMETLMLEDIQPVIDQLARVDPEPGQEPLMPPSLEKLQKNSLSDDAASLLRVGRRKEALVDAWFRKNPRADLGERIAEAFRHRYARLKEEDRSPDEIFAHLQEYAGSGREPGRVAASLAVLSYFFDRCDIFEDPEVGDDPADQTHSA